MKLPQSWTFRQISAEQESLQQEWSEKFRLSPFIARLLVQRDLETAHQAEKFLHGTLADIPNPFLLTDMDRAVDRLLSALAKKEKVLFFGDYDVDGITGSAQIQAFFREIGFITHVHLPHRMKGGYGLTPESVHHIISLKPDLLVTIDNGTSSRDAIHVLKENAIDVVVVDHHETPSEADRPDVTALINPKTAGSRFPDRNIASAGLIFLLLMAFRSRLREQGGTVIPTLRRYLDLACLGTIADIVPLIGTNRLIVKYGLEELSKTGRVGLKSLMDLAQVTPPATAGSVSFRIAPRINAAGRLDDPRLALDLLLAEDPYEAGKLARRLHDLNAERQVLEEKAVRESVTMVEEGQQGRKGLVVSSPDWHLGVVGIVAAKLVDRFRKPAVVLAQLSDSLAKGSARTIPGLSVHQALDRSSEMLLHFGGHDAAAGLAVSVENLDLFARKFNEAVQDLWPNTDPTALVLDAPLSLKEIDRSLVQQLQLLEPHGAGNPEPVFVTGPVRLSHCRVVGTKHLKTVVLQDEFRFPAIGFGWGEYLQKAGGYHHLVFQPHFNAWNGVESIQLKIKSLQPSLPT